MKSINSDQKNEVNRVLPKTIHTIIDFGITLLSIIHTWSIEALFLFPHLAF